MRNTELKPFSMLTCRSMGCAIFGHILKIKGKGSLFYINVLIFANINNQSSLRTIILLQPHRAISFVFSGKSFPEKKKVLLSCQFPFSTGYDAFATPFLECFFTQPSFYSSTCTFTITLRILPCPIPGACPSSGK